VNEPERFVTMEEFHRCRLRAGEVVGAERVESNTRHLLLHVAFGAERCAALAPIAKFYDPEETVGKHVVVLCNLPPTTVAGVRVRGLVLVAYGAGEVNSLVTVDRPVNRGAEVR